MLLYRKNIALLVWSLTFTSLLTACSCYNEEEVCKLACSCDNVIDCDYVSDFMSIHGEYFLMEEYVLTDEGATCVKEHVTSAEHSDDWDKACSVEDYERQGCINLILSGFDHNEGVSEMTHKMKKSIDSGHSYVNMSCSQEENRSKVYIFDVQARVLFVAEYYV